MAEQGCRTCQMVRGEHALTCPFATSLVDGRCPMCGATAPDHLAVCRRHPTSIAKRLDELRADTVEHPKHYTSLGAACLGCGRTIECIDVVEHMDFRRGNAMKYLWRAGDKGDVLEDLKKARWYIEREIATIEAARKKGDGR